MKSTNFKANMRREATRRLQPDRSLPDPKPTSFLGGGGEPASERQTYFIICFIVSPQLWLLMATSGETSQQLSLRALLRFVGEIEPD